MNNSKIISFDIDNTLIPYSDEFPTTKPSFLYRCLGTEPLRKGTKELFSSLHKQGFKIWIYTTSYRSIFRLRMTFKSAGLSPSKYINENINRATLKMHNCKASKNPSLFGIDFHVDDSEGVKKEGEKYGFQSILIKPEDLNWIYEVQKQIDNLCLKV